MADRITRFTNLHVVALVTIVAMVVGAHGGGVPVLSFSCGLALALVLPGYALVAALFAPGALGGPERALLTIGLSIAVAILGGLALNFLPTGLRPLTWSVLLGDATLIADTVALLRRHGTLLEVPRALSSFARPREAAMMAAALALVVGACVLSGIGEAQQLAHGTTELWMLPGKAANSLQTVTVGIDNQDDTAMSYSLTVTLAGNDLQVIAPIRLRAGDKWQTTLVVPAHGGSAPSLLEVQLASLGTATPIARHVSLWLAPNPASPASTAPQQDAPSSLPGGGRRSESVSG